MQMISTSHKFFFKYSRIKITCVITTIILFLTSTILCYLDRKLSELIVIVLVTLLE
jgi:hypothetical protein